MLKNIGQPDRILRLVAGAGLLLATLAFGLGAGSAALFWILTVVGAILLITGLLGFCPLYRLIGVSTCRLGR